MKVSKQIVCISTYYWDDAWFRKQHFMSRFAENGYRVAYIEPSFSMAKKPDRDKCSFQSNKLFGVVVEERSENLFIIKPPQGIPFWSHPAVSRLNYVYFAFQLGKVLKKLKFNKYMLWNYRPEYAPALDLFDYNEIVFDLTDDLAAYRGKNNKKYYYIKKCTEQLVDRSSMLIVTASTLFDMYRNAAKNICLVPNGFDSDLFSRNSAVTPENIKGIKGPVVGFIGTLFSFLDYDLLEFIIEKNPDKSFVFIGNCEESVKERWAEISRSKNVYWLGKKPKDEIPSYVNSFDLCINPFRVDDVSKSVSPLKVFEYLAMKKPVVSVNMESLQNEEISKYIYFSSSYQDFHDKINFAISEKGSFENRLDYDVVMKYSWERLFEKLVGHLNSI